MRHEDVSKKNAGAVSMHMEEWYCISFTDLIDEMELWD